MTRFIIILLTIFSFYSCNSQQVIKEINRDEIRVLNLTKSNIDYQEEVFIFTSQEKFDEFQFNLPKTEARSNPIFNIDFNNKNIAVLYKPNVGGFNVKFIQIKNKKYIIELEEIKGYQNSRGSNLMLIEVPKEVNKLTLKK